MEDHVRYRGGGGGGLGRSSGGAFNGVVISAHNQGDNARPFDPSVFNLQTRRELIYLLIYNLASLNGPNNARARTQLTLSLMN